MNAKLIKTRNGFFVNNMILKGYQMQRATGNIIKIRRQRHEGTINAHFI